VSEREPADMPEPSPEARVPRHLEVKATLLIALLVMLVTTAVVYLMYARGAFEETQELVLLADDTEGVLVGMDLTFAGFPIGRVRQVALAEGGTGRIVIDVPRKDAKWLRSSSVFTLTRGLVGNTNLRAFTGIPEDPPLAPGTERKVLMGDATAEIPRLVAETRELIGNLTRFTAEGGPIATSLDHLQTFSAKLAGPHGALGALLGSEADAKKISATIDATRALIARADALVVDANARLFGPDGLAAKADAEIFGRDALLPEVRATVRQLDAGLSEARDTLKKVDAVLRDVQAITANARDASTDLASLRAEVDANLRKLGRMIDEINRRWPFAKDAEIKLP